MMQYAGHWRSKQYPQVCGVIRIELPKLDVEKPFSTQIELQYSEESPLFTGELRTLPVNVICGIDTRGMFRLTMQKAVVDLEKTFICTLVQEYPNEWSGNYASVYPIDFGTVTIRHGRKEF